MNKIRFDALQVGRTFTMNGNTYEKISTRTARIIEPSHLAGAWFYFCNNDICTIGNK